MSFAADMSSLSFFTACDYSNRVGTMALWRSIRAIYPQAPFCVITECSTLQNSGMLQRVGIRVVPPMGFDLDAVPVTKRVYYLRYAMGNVPGEYLVYIDADAILLGVPESLLSVPQGRYGAVMESEFFVGEQFANAKPALDIIESQFCPSNQPCINSGVIAAWRSAWIMLGGEMTTQVKRVPRLLDYALHDQGMFMFALLSSGLLAPLPRECNVYYKDWRGNDKAIIHFWGSSKPWMHNSLRPLRRYPAFRRWLGYSRLRDYSDIRQSFVELSCRFYDRVRPVLRGLRKWVAPRTGTGCSGLDSREKRS